MSACLFQSVPIGLINTYSTLNLGDGAIYAGLRALMPDEQILACVRDPEPDPSLGIRYIDRHPEQCLAYVSVGGDIFNNAREGLITKTFLRNLLELRRHPKRTLLFGQSIPRSCHGLSFHLLCRAMKRLGAVCVRDAQSHGRLRKAGVEAQLSFDTAFVLESTEAGRRAAAALYRSLGINPMQAVLLSVRAFDSMYTHDNSGFIRSIVGLCQGVLQRRRRPVILLQSRAYGADNDLEVARAITEQVPETAVLDPFDAAPLSAWQVAMGALELAERAIAVRYHTAVLCLAAGRIPYHLHYSNKGRDLCERLQLPGCDLGGLRCETVLAELFSTPADGFDHPLIRGRVRRDFRRCLERVCSAERR